MIRSLLGFLLIVSAPYCVFSQNTGAEIVFTKSKYKFGFVRAGEKVRFSYNFINKGAEDLIITEAKAECSCTEVSFPLQPVKSGEMGKIEVIFDTAGKIDRQDRIIEIISNSKTSPVRLRFKGVVLKSKK